MRIIDKSGLKTGILIRQKSHPSHKITLLFNNLIQSIFITYQGACDATSETENHEKACHQKNGNEEKVC